MQTGFLAPQILSCKVALASDLVKLVVTPRNPLTDEDFNRLRELFNLDPPPGFYDFVGIRCRVRLLGRAIFAKTEKRPLDGFVPMRPAGERVELDFNNRGIGQPSDFESWFYLVEG